MTKTPVPSPRRAGALGLSYRKVTGADLSMLYRIYASTRRAEMAITGWDEAEQARFLRFQFDAQHAHYQKHYPDAAWLLIGQGVAPVGRLYLEAWSREVRVIDIAFLEGFRGRGWGRAVLEDLQEDAAAAGKAVSIHVERQNPAMRLYKRLGFRRIDEVSVYDLMEWRAGAGAPDQANTAS